MLVLELIVVLVLLGLMTLGIMKLKALGGVVKDDAVALVADVKSDIVDVPVVIDPPVVVVPEEEKKV